MLPYFIIYAYILSAYIINEKYKEKSKLINFVFDIRTVFMITFLFAGLRGNGNGDYFSYINNVKLVTNFDFVLHPVNFPFELGYRLIAYVINILNLNPQVIVLVMNGISIYSVYKFSITYSKNPFLSSVLFFPFLLLFDMHHSRAAVGMSLGLWFVAYLYEKKYLRSIFMLVIAYNFHRSSLVLLVIVPFVVFSLFKRIQQLLIKKPFLKILGLMIFIIIFTVFDPLDMITQLLNNPFTYKFYNKFSSYIANERWSYPFKIYDPRFLLILFNYVYFTFIYYETSKFNELLMSTMLLSIVSIVMLKSSTILTVRVYNYFHLFSIVLIPNILDVKENSIAFVVNLTDRKFTRNSVKRIDTTRIISLFNKLLIVSYCIYTVALITKQYEYFFFF